MRVLAVVGLVLGVSACPPSEDPDDETCAAEEELRARVTTIVTNHRECDVDADCTTLNANISCPGADDAIGQCSLIVSAAKRDEAAAELAALHEDLCANQDVSCVSSVDCSFAQPVCRNEICVGDS